VAMKKRIMATLIDVHIHGFHQSWFEEFQGKEKGRQRTDALETRCLSRFQECQENIPRVSQDTKLLKHWSLQLALAYRDIPMRRA
jgi:hypothetical protein